MEAPVARAPGTPYMSFIDRARDLVQRALGPTPEESALEEPAAPLPHRHERSDHDERAEEFRDFLSDIGAEAVETRADDELARKDREIAELQRNLEMLRPLGDELATAEQRRLAERGELSAEIDALQARLVAIEGPAPDPDRALIPAEVRALARLVGDLETALGRTASPDQPSTNEAEETSQVADPQREVKRLREILEKREAAKERAEERLAMWRERGEEMKEKAAERWFELRELQGRVSELEKELRAQRRTLQLLQRPVRELRKRFPDGPKALDRIVELLGLEEDDS